ncbi:hypothetical protein EB796_001839 [Bugula neritina]|uniref:Uncharacterized protein n=1 Tax=Bugula neritina TaxID=10212 RepID=A0A7J7KNX1_BUGNE|nr:hypothetical protein EB796_001839 [Bugula neritina]
MDRETSSVEYVTSMATHSQISGNTLKDVTQSGRISCVTSDHLAKCHKARFNSPAVVAADSSLSSGIAEDTTAVLIDDMSHTLVVHSDGSIVHADGSVMYADSGNVIETSTVHTVSADSGIPSQSSQSYVSEKGVVQ